MITIRHRMVNDDWLREVMMGVRNSFNSWYQSDTDMTGTEVIFGEKDYDLLKQLSRCDASERKFLRQIPILMVVEAPLYWWKEFDTYKVGTTSNSTSTMHTIMKKRFDYTMFSTDQLLMVGEVALEDYISELNNIRDRWLECEDSKLKKKLWYNIIQLLPSSWMQKRTVSLNYEVLKNIYKQRRGHKLEEWRKFCDYIETLPLNSYITQ